MEKLITRYGIDDTAMDIEGVAYIEFMSATIEDWNYIINWNLPDDEKIKDIKGYIDTFYYNDIDLLIGHAIEDDYNACASLNYGDVYKNNQQLTLNQKQIDKLDKAKNVQKELNQFIKNAK